MTRITQFGLTTAICAALGCSGTTDGGGGGDGSAQGEQAGSSGMPAGNGQGSAGESSLDGMGSSQADPSASLGGGAGSSGSLDGSDAGGAGSGGAGTATAGQGAGGTDAAGAGDGGAGGTTTAQGGASGADGVADPETILGHPDPAADYPNYDDFTLYLVEEFNSPLDLDNDPIWTWGDGALYEGLTRMVKDNIAFEAGNMVLRVTDTAQPGAYSFSAADNVAQKPLSSGELRTLYNNFRYGRYEVRMKAPSGASNYIFTMFTYRTPAYLLWREIDIELQASPDNTFISNIIVAPPGQRKWSSAIEDATTSYPYGAGGEALPAGLNTQNAFHTYAFEWLPDQVKWYVDGTLIRIKQSGVGKNSLLVPDVSAKIVMNLWVFTNPNLGGGSPDDNTYPITGYYDWFRFYRWNGESDYPCEGVPGCLPADDLTLAKNNAADPLPDIRPELCTGEEGDIDAPCGN